ncbi:SSI family serine proteinase inhibitor [Streptomyces sp. NPDC058691]|uniref:SSI family serine proteinase inhibitor n=1 Tax=Streptomyces sp. NPDC058691 TaxID=3346601 RepID=UPI0036581783
MARMPLTAALALGLSLTAAAPAPACPPDRAGDRLTVIVDDGKDGLSSYELRCGPGGGRGTHPDARGACDRLRRLGGPVGPAPKGTQCTMIYGGPQRARVRGTWDGRPVDDRYDRTNGCEADRWRRMAPVLPATPGAAPGGAFTEPPRHDPWA